MHGYLSEGYRWLEALLAKESTEAAAVWAKALRSAGVLATVQGDYGHASALLEESLAQYRELGNKDGIAWGVLATWYVRS
jgi:hypothetical protein